MGLTRLLARNLLSDNVGVPKAKFGIRLKQAPLHLAEKPAKPTTAKYTATLQDKRYRRVRFGLEMHHCERTSARLKNPHLPLLMAKTASARRAIPPGSTHGRFAGFTRTQLQRRGMRKHDPTPILGGSRRKSLLSALVHKPDNSTKSVIAHHL